jgi:hypothetical protein
MAYVCPSRSPDIVEVRLMDEELRSLVEGEGQIKVNVSDGNPSIPAGTPIPQKLAKAIRHAVIVHLHTTGTTLKNI